MGHGSGKAVHSNGSREARALRNSRLNGALHQSVFAHFTRPVADPDHPGRWISYGELELRLRGRAYRQAAMARPEQRHL